MFSEYGVSFDDYWLIIIWLAILTATYPYAYYKKYFSPFILYTIFGVFILAFLAPLYIWFFNFPVSFTTTFTSVAFVLYAGYYLITISRRKKSGNE